MHPLIDLIISTDPGVRDRALDAEVARLDARPVGRLAFLHVIRIAER